jgi:hypothetical protein
VLRLGERLEHSGRRVDAQVVEDREVEDQERQQGAGQAEQQPGGMAGGPVDVACAVVGMGVNIT